MRNWPHDLVGAGAPPDNELPFSSHEALCAATARHHLTHTPAYRPVYSNTGTALLGMAVVAANKAAFRPDEPTSYAELVKRDILVPLGMNGSHFLVTPLNKHLIVVPSLEPGFAVSTRPPSPVSTHSNSFSMAGLQFPRRHDQHQENRPKLFVNKL